MARQPLPFTLFLFALLGLASFPPAVDSQTPDRRSTARSGKASQPAAVPPVQRTPVHRLPALIDRVYVEGASARQALEWWSTTTAIPIVVNWSRLELEGFDSEAQINLRLQRVPAHTVLKLILGQFSPDEELIVEPSPWYIEIMTREQALHRSEVRIYDISDLLHFVPNFDDTPSFDLQAALSNTSSGGGGRGGRGGRGSNGGGLFGDSSRQEKREPRIAGAERAEALIQSIRQTIEPEIWQAHGGQYASIRYYHRRLIVNAPPFVHRQIGMTSTAVGRSARRAHREVGKAPTSTSTRKRGFASNRHSPGGVAGIHRASATSNVSSIR